MKKNCCRVFSPIIFTFGTYMIKQFGAVGCFML